VTAKGSGRAAARRWAVYGLFVASASLLPRRASAEIELANINGWQVISDGRAGGFVSWAHGDGYPQPTYATDTNGNYVPLSSPIGGGWKAVTNQGVLIDPTLTGGTVIPNQGTIDLWRVRSGMIANVFGFGVRSPITPGTRFISYVQFWAYIENNGRQKNLQNVPDARQGYAGLEGPWGTLLAGRMRGLFSRGNTDIDVLYAHPETSTTTGPRRDSWGSACSAPASRRASPMPRRWPPASSSPWACSIPSNSRDLAVGRAPSSSDRRRRRWAIGGSGGWAGW